MFLDFLNFGLLGDPVAVSHAGGIVGSLAVLLCLRPARRTRMIPPLPARDFLLGA
jgi:hypothetical protein